MCKKLWKIVDFDFSIEKSLKMVGTGNYVYV